MSTLLSNRTITTSKSVQIISNKSSNLFVNLLESRIFSRTAKYRKVTIELLTPVKNLGEKGEIVKVKPGYMRNDLYPSRKANYFIPTVGKNKSLQSKGPSQIHQIAKGGQITLAILGRSYADKKKNAPRVLQYFEEIQKKVAILNHIPSLDFDRDLDGDLNIPTKLQNPVKLEDILNRVKSGYNMIFNLDDIEFHENNSGEIHRTGDYKCLFHFREIQIKVPVKIVVKPSIGFQGTKETVIR
ncbi:3830_t:CDS:2 [Funneliformis caledonium]|uniref:3830_t:CDS:1 n=1 Tax=Funneliformis caledonium TaxID=1117310 RepID=A0A9N9HLW0_9GLOM|nr:3830_t:CDS:2 [Funneliformis caledonium]